VAIQCNYPESSPDLSLLAHEVPCAMPISPAWHHEMLECGEFGRRQCLAQFICRGVVSVIEEANIRVLECSNSQRWEMRGI